MHLTSSDRRLLDPGRLPPAWAAGIAVAAMLLVFALDRATGAAPVQHLYYLAIILAGVRFGMAGGVAAGVLSVILYHVANPHLLTFRYEESDLVQIGLFLAVGAIAAKVAHDAEQLRRLAMTDDLTGLHNLRAFEVRYGAIVDEARRSRMPFAILVLDLDRLKAINDRFGHLAGAEAVRTVGQIIGRHAPPDAVACRYGGDEFAVAVPACEAFRAHRIADDLCRAVHASAPVLAGTPFDAGALSISIGVASTHFVWPAAAPAEGTTSGEVGRTLFRAADAALYRAKARGRNQVCVA